jgi:tetratricopeptide (TPR) repeat protein
MTGQKPPPQIPAGSGGREQGWRVAAVCLALAAITLAVFGQTAGFEFVNFDDNAYVYENAKVTGGLSLKSLAWFFTHPYFCQYIPVTMLSFVGDHQLHGLRAGWYHFTNVALHTASVLLLFLILRQMTGALWRSAFVAAVFAIHPLRVESVAWVTERKDVLSGFFFMLTLGAYARYAENFKFQISNFKFYYIAALLLFAMALLSKSSVTPLPFALLLLDYWPLRRFEQSRKLSGLILEKIPLLALAAGACVMTVLATEKWTTHPSHIPVPSRFGSALVYYVVYLRQMAWPEGLATPYPNPRNGWPGWEVALAGALLAGLSAIAWWQRRGRPWLLMGWLWYLGMLVPMIGIVPASPFAQADRYTYLPQIGICVAVTWLVAEWRASRAVLGGLMAGVIAVLMICAWKQTSYWQNSETLWTHTLACTTDNGVAGSNLGGDLLRKGRVDDAIDFYQKRLQIEPDNADSHNNFGLALLEKGRVEEAISQFQRALEIRPENASARLDLGSALRRKGRVDEAMLQYQKALQLEPDNVEAQNNLAWLLATCPDPSLRNGYKAVELARQADALTGGENPIILRTLAAAFAEAGRFSEAVKTAQRALPLAGTQSNSKLAGQLQSEIKLYQSGNPFHSPAQTH